MVLTTIAAVPEPTQTVLPEVVVTEGEEQVEEEIVEMEVHGLDLDVSLVINLILFLNFKIKYFTYLLIIKLIGFFFRSFFDILITNKALKLADSLMLLNIF